MRRNVPQRNDEEGGKQTRLSFSPAALVWGQMGRAWTTDKRNTPRITGPSLWRATLPCFISISVSPTSRSSPLLRRNDAAARDTWAGRVAGTT
jgi:hypothetical protein